MFFLNRHFILVATFFLGACGGGGSSGDPKAPPTSSVTASISASANKVFIGNSAVITWDSRNASACTASDSWSGDKSSSGSETLAMTTEGEQLFTITCDDVSVNVTITVTSQDFEGSCMNPHSAEIPQSYVGEYEIPFPENSFDQSHLRAMGFKDYGVRWIYQGYSDSYHFDGDQSADWVLDCTQTEYTHLMLRETLRRLKEHGVTTASIYNFGYWNDDGAWKIDHSTKHISDEDIAFIASTALELGMDIHYVWQFNIRVADEQRLLFPFDGMARIDMPLLEKIMAAHEGHMLWEAEHLESLGVNAISADWSAMWLCFSCGIDNQGHTQAETDALKEFYMQRMGEIISGIRERFSGKIYVGEGPQWNDERVADKVDGILFSFPNLLNDEEIDTATVDLIEQRAAAYLLNAYNAYYCLDSQPCWSRTSTDTTKHKMIFNLPAQSHADYLSTGWVEDGFCVSGQGNDDDYLGSDVDCIQRTMQPDFSAQAIWYEGVLRAINKQSYFNTLGTTSSTGYWLSDTLLHDGKVEAFPSISQSIRGKSAEKILKYWYTGEFEAYEPTFND
ncbi:MAG: hypothetical protein ABNH02_00620 [Pseudomonadales bacterium]|jgi:hypothetical protein